MRFKGIFLFFMIILTCFSWSIPHSYGKSDNLVYIVPVEKTVEKGLYAFLSRAVSEAEKDHATAIIFEVNTPGGAVDAAGEIGKLLTSTAIRTVAFVNNQALSAGAYISLNMDEIYMVPGATMGSAAIIDRQGNTAGKKAESYWYAAMKSAAENSHRDPIYALAMADESVDLPELGAEKGKLLTLTADQAIKVGYAEGIVANQKELLKQLNLEDAPLKRIDESFSEKLARFITNPFVIPILLSIGSLGLVLELFSPGFGISGFIGLSSLLLFFYGHLVAGLAGYETIILFVVGVLLMFAELFLPGGLVGFLGLAAILGSFFLASDNFIHMGISIVIALFISIFASIFMIKVLGRKMSFFKKIILTDSTNTEQGYVSNLNRTDLVGKNGITLTQLRPAGKIMIKDEIIDAVSEGSFIQKDMNVKVIKVEGSRIVVREILE
ncbi:MAG TPA: nodulation protein NfeD [Pseudoneobacillus sp.]|nr:nodulation protein NfeD [Pseudoneobacillus sp.]